MPGRRSLLKVAAVLAAMGAVAVAAILLNLALLGGTESRNDPAGKLSPRAVLPTAATRPVTAARPAATTTASTPRPAATSPAASTTQAPDDHGDRKDDDGHDDRERDD